MSGVEYGDDRVLRSGCCLAEIVTTPVDPPPPPGALLAIASAPVPDSWTGVTWTCAACGAALGYSYDYGTVDLDLVRDDQLDSRPADFEVLG